MVKLEVGKYYKTREGKKVGPAEHNDCIPYPFNVPHGGRFMGYASDGKLCLDDIKYRDHDIIAEWSDAPASPVRTVTRKEIVPGEYGKVGVGEAHGDVIWLGLRQPNGDYDLCSLMCAADLRAAIATLAEIAEALETK